MVGILGYGAYVPRYRIEQKEIRKVWPYIASLPGIKEKAVPDVDEDVVTMGVEAAAKALEMTKLNSSKIGALFVATTSSPMIEKSIGTVMQKVIDLPGDSLVYDLNGSSRCGSLALRAAVDYYRSTGNYALVVISDNRLPEMASALEYSLGAASVAFIVGGDSILCEINGWVSLNDEYTARWLDSGSSYIKYHEDPRAEREHFIKIVSEAINKYLTQEKANLDKYSYLVTSQLDGRSLDTIAKKVRFPNNKKENDGVQNLTSRIGDTGASSAFIELIQALENAKSEEGILVASYGPGAGCDVFSVTTTSNLLSARNNSNWMDYMLSSDTDYLDYASFAKRMGYMQVPQALPDPISGYYNQPSMMREISSILSLKAYICSRCSSINYPPRHYCIDCRNTEFTETRLPKTGQIVTYNVQNVLPLSPEEPPIIVATARLSGANGERGGKVSAAMIQTDISKIKIGTKVELILRRCGVELGVPKYGYKFKPLENKGRRRK